MEPLKLVLVLLVGMSLAVNGCAPLLPLALGVQGAIGAGANIIGGVKWWEDRHFQREALDNQRAMTQEIRELREAVERHQEEVRKLRETNVP